MDEETFRITTEGDKDREQLVHSLTAVGLLAPPILRPGKTKTYLVVAGFRRLTCLRRLGISMVSARLLPAETEDLTCLKISISDNLLQRSLNPGELARALTKLTALSKSPQDLRRTAAELCLPANPGLIEKFRIVSGLPEKIFDYFSQEWIPLAVASRLAALEPETALVLADLFADLRLGLNKQQEMLTLIEEIAAREEKTCWQILHEQGLRRILEAEDKDRGRRAAEIRNYLQERRFPAITRKYAHFARQAQTLIPGSRMRFSPPHNFENTDYSLQLLFKDPAELEEHGRRLTEIIHSPALKELFREE